MLQCLHYKRCGVIMKLKLFISFILSLIFSTVVYIKNIDTVLANILICTTIHFCIMILSAPIIRFVFNKKFNHYSFWFGKKRFEKHLYQFLKIKKWKHILPIYDNDDYNLKTHTIDEIINNMWHAEIVHEFISITGYLSILFGQVICNYKILIITSFIFSLIHISFALVQRYNRARLIRINTRINNRSNEY